LVRAISEASDDGNNPAKNRAVSSGVADSEHHTGAMLSASMNVIAIANVALSMDEHDL